MNSKQAFTMLSIMAMMSQEKPLYRRTKEEDIDNTLKTPPMPKGMKQWNIDGVEVWAVTKKAAMKKAKRM